MAVVGHEELPVGLRMSDFNAFNSIAWDLDDFGREMDAIPLPPEIWNLLPNISQTQIIQANPQDAHLPQDGHDA